MGKLYVASKRPPVFCPKLTERAFVVTATIRLVLLFPRVKRRVGEKAGKVQGAIATILAVVHCLPFSVPVL